MCVWSLCAVSSRAVSLCPCAMRMVVWQDWGKPQPTRPSQALTGAGKDALSSRWEDARDSQGGAEDGRGLEHLRGGAWQGIVGSSSLRPASDMYDTGGLNGEG